MAPAARLFLVASLLLKLFLFQQAFALSTAAPDKRPRWITLVACMSFEGATTKLTADAKRRVDTFLANGKIESTRASRLMLFTDRSIASEKADERLVNRRVSYVREKVLRGYLPFAVDVMPQDSFGVKPQWLATVCEPDDFVLVQDLKSESFPPACTRSEDHSCELKCNFVSCDRLYPK